MYGPSILNMYIPSFFEKKFRYIIGETVCAVRTSEMGGPPSLTPPKGTTITGWARVLPPPLLERRNQRLRLHILSLSESLPAKNNLQILSFFRLSRIRKKNREGVTCHILYLLFRPIHVWSFFWAGNWILQGISATYETETADVLFFCRWRTSPKNRQTKKGKKKEEGKGGMTSSLSLLSFPPFSSANKPKKTSSPFPLLTLPQIPRPKKRFLSSKNLLFRHFFHICVASRVPRNQLGGARGGKISFDSDRKTNNFPFGKYAGEKKERKKKPFLLPVFRGNEVGGAKTGGGAL